MTQQVKKSKIGLGEVTENWDTIEEKPAQSYRPTPVKNKRSNPVEAHPNARQKLMNFMDEKVAARKEIYDEHLKNLSKVHSQQDIDCEAMEETQRQLEHLMGAMRKNMQQTIAAHRQANKDLKDAIVMFKKKSEDVENEHKAGSSKLAESLAEDMRSLEQKLVADTRRKLAENMRKSIFTALQHDL